LETRNKFIKGFNVAKLTKEDIKNYMVVTAGVSTYDAAINSAIDFAYGYLDAWVGLETGGTDAAESVSLLDPADLGHTDTESDALDIDGYQVKFISVQVGPLTGVDSSNYLTPVLQESDTNVDGDFIDVDAEDMDGSFNKIDSASEDSAVQCVNYKGNKRYIRASLVYNGTGITAGIIGISGFLMFPDDALDKFKEFGNIQNNSDDEKYIMVSGVAKDILLSKVKIEGEEILPASDLSPVDFSNWEIINTNYLSDEYKNYYVEYTSSNLTAKVKKILIEIIIFEVQKLPIVNNSISTKMKSIEGNTTEQFVTDETFYKRIDNALNELFTRGL
jgi:hypothetical protein